MKNNNKIKNLKKNELGVIYKKRSIITRSEYNYRI